MPTFLSQVGVISMKTTPLSLVMDLLKHLFWLLPLVTLLVLGVYLRSVGCQLGVRIKLLFVFTYLPITTLLAISFLNHIGFFSFASVAIIVMTLILL